MTRRSMRWSGNSQERNREKWGPPPKNLPLRRAPPTEGFEKPPPILSEEEAPVPEGQTLPETEAAAPSPTGQEVAEIPEIPAEEGFERPPPILAPEEVAGEPAPEAPAEPAALPPEPAAPTVETAEPAGTGIPQAAEGGRVESEPSAALPPRERHKQRVEGYRGGLGTLRQFIQAHGGISSDADAGTEMWEELSRQEAGTKPTWGMSPLVQRPGSGKGLEWSRLMRLAKSVGFFPRGDVDEQGFIEAVRQDPVAGAVVGSEAEQEAAAQFLMEEEGLSFDEAQEEAVRRLSMPGGSLQSMSFAYGGPPPVKGLDFEIGNIGKGALPAARAFAQRNLTSRGDIPETAFQSMIERDAGVNVANQAIRFATRDFRSAARKVYGGVNKMTPDQVRAVDQAFKNAELIPALPEQMRAPVRQMREHVDALSRALVDAGVVAGDLAARILDNLGLYATRSYRVFDDPDWAKKVPAEVRNKAKAFLRHEFLSRREKTISRLEQRKLIQHKQERLQGLRRQMARIPTEAEGPKGRPAQKLRAIQREAENLLQAELPAAERQRIREQVESARPEPTEDKLQAYIDHLLYEGKAAESPIALLSRSKLGAKDLSILKRRKDIAPEIRALFGEYEDALVNYARSVSKMSHLIANHQFLEGVREEGIEEGWLTAPEDGPRAQNIVRIAADESKVMHPLNGYWTTPEIKRAFEEAMEREAMPDWLRYYLAVNSTVKMSKTVGSVITHVRNFFGNVGFAVTNGLWRPGGFNEAFKSIATKFGAMNSQEWRTYYQDALGHGVIHESARAGELRDMIRDAIDKDPGDVLNGQARTDLKKPLRFLMDLYQSQDDFWKIYAWENEKARYGEAYPEWSESELKTKTAEIVRNTFPTYSLVPRTIKKLRRFPVVGTFVSFPAEVLRVTGNTLRQIKVEMADPKTAKIGAERLIGATLSATGTTAAAIASRFLLGIGADDDEDAREFMPEWSRDSDIIWLGKSKKGNWLWVDVGYTDPYSYLKEPVRALMRGENWQEGAVEAFKRAAEPFLSEEILLEAIRESVTMAEEGKPTDEIVNRMWDAVEPGTISSARRIKKGLSGEVTSYGKAFNPKVEALATMSGVRVNELDVQQALSFRASDYKRELTNATRLLTRVASRRGTVSEAELRNAYSDMESRRRDVYDRMRRVVDAAIGLRVPREQIQDILRGSLSQAETRALLNAAYQPYRPSDSFLQWYGKRADTETKAEYSRRKAFLRTLADETGEK